MNKEQCIRYVEEHMVVRYATRNGAYQSGRKIYPQGCVNHSLGCAQPRADTIYQLMNREDAGWAVNAILGDFDMGDGVIIVTMPLDARPWGCYKGRNGSWNNSRVQWEICEPAGHTYAGGTMIGYDVEKNQGYFDRMWKMLVAWNVYVADKFGYPASAIADHAESYRAGYGSNHADISQWIPKHGKTMDDLRREVQEILNGGGEEEVTLEEFKKLYAQMREELRDNDSGDWSEEDREWAIKVGLIRGGSPLPNGEPNYMWEDTLTREQMVTMLHRQQILLEMEMSNMFSDIMREVHQK